LNEKLESKIKKLIDNYKHTLDYLIKN